MSSIHFVGGEKGGIGKSVLARLFSQWFLDHSASWCALDAQLSGGALLRAHPKHCRALDLSVLESADQIMDLALGAEREVVVDLTAHSFRRLLRWLQTGDVFGLANEANVRLVFWHVTDGGFESQNLLEKALQELPSSVQVHVVCNRRWTSDFSQLEASRTLSQLQERGGQVLELPALDAPVMYQIEKLGVSLGVVLQEKESSESGLTPMQRRRVAHWLDLAYAKLEPILVESTRERANLLPHESTREKANPPPPAHHLAKPALGDKWIDGPRTWTEVAEDGLIHHVRFR